MLVWCHVHTGGLLAEEARINDTHGEESHVHTLGPIVCSELPFNPKVVLSDAVVAVNQVGVNPMERRASADFAWNRAPDVRRP